MVLKWNLTTAKQLLFDIILATYLDCNIAKNIFKAVKYVSNAVNKSYVHRFINCI